MSTSKVWAHVGPEGDPVLGRDTVPENPVFMSGGHVQGVTWYMCEANAPRAHTWEYVVGLHME